MQQIRVAIFDQFPLSSEIVGCDAQAAVTPDTVGNGIIVWRGSGEFVMDVKNHRAAIVIRNDRGLEDRGIGVERLGSLQLQPITVACHRHRQRVRIGEVKNIVMAIGGGDCAVNNFCLYLQTVTNIEICAKCICSASHKRVRRGEGG